MWVHSLYFRHLVQIRMIANALSISVRKLCEFDLQSLKHMLKRRPCKTRNRSERFLINVVLEMINIERAPEQVVRHAG